MKELEYPFNGSEILKKKKSLKRELLGDGSVRLKKRIAVLGGSTTANAVQVLELFLLNYGIEPEFYESEYDKFYEDAVFGNPELDAFSPDVAIVHTSIHNITEFPTMKDSAENIARMADAVMDKFSAVWDAMKAKGAVVIQNNFEYPTYRLLGNKDSVDIHGRVSFVNLLNERFAAAAREREGLYINDVNYLSALAGLDNWCDPFYWNMYKYCPAVSLIPELAFSYAKIIKSLFGMNKKAFALDLDNTLWGGIVGDDGPENLKMGSESAEGETFSEFQNYLKAHKDLGIILNVVSKNQEENALAGLNAYGCALRPDDFISIKANWEPKSVNLKNLATELSLGEDAFVFVDDNPAERHIVRSEIPKAAVPEIGEPLDYIKTLDRSGFFEVTTVSADDASRVAMYKANAERQKARSSFENYKDYLLSLEMKGEIAAFKEPHIARISQLTNKSNQFNLTTLRCTEEDIVKMAGSPEYVTIYGRLTDRFGDNGLVSVEAAKIGCIEELLKDELGVEMFSSTEEASGTAAGQTAGAGCESDLSGDSGATKYSADASTGNSESASALIILNLMSCRVLKRDMEVAMLDELAAACLAKGVKSLYGVYLPTKKNAMVKELYGELGFTLTAESEGISLWRLELEGYEKRCKVIDLTDEI